MPTGTISRSTPTCRASSKRTSGRGRRNGRRRSPGLSRRGDRSICDGRRHDQAHFLPPRLRLHALPERRRLDARRLVHPRRDRRLAARGRRRLPYERRDLRPQQGDDRGPRPRRPQDPPARPVADRGDPLRRSRAAVRRAAGDGDADPEHQPGVGRAGAEEGEARLRPRRPLRLRPRAGDDRDRGDGRHRPAGDDVPRARRHLSRRRAPIHHPRPEAGRPRRANAGPTIR